MGTIMLGKCLTSWQILQYKTLEKIKGEKIQNFNLLQNCFIKYKRK